MKNARAVNFKALYFFSSICLYNLSACVRFISEWVFVTGMVRMYAAVKKDRSQIRKTANGRHHWDGAALVYLLFCTSRAFKAKGVQ
jgi:hypothetical protein